jgi:hypothetical protein
MKTIRRMTLPALAVVALAAFAVQGGSEKKGSLKHQVVGAWTMVSNVLDQDGKKTEPYGSDAKGSVILTNTGRVALIITRSDIPKFAVNNRTQGTPEENKAVVAGSIAYFGTYTVDEPGKTLVMKLEGSTFPNWTGTEQKRTLELSGDQMKFINQSPSMGAGLITVTWKRVKEPKITAQR